MIEAPAAILGSSRAAQQIREFARIAAAVDAPVLITGETGTGKGVLAAAIHHASGRRVAPFVTVNCAGIPETLFESEFFGHTRGAFTGAHQSHRGLFEQAHRATLFLDEIGELTLPMQAKLLTAVEQGEVRKVGAEASVRVDVRVIAATGVDLESAVARRDFRSDLYHRLLVLAFHMPALRDRESDILLLARHFVCTSAARYSRRVGDLDAGAVRLIERYSWPGNIRQLAHAMEAAVLHADGPCIRGRDIPARILTQPAIPGHPAGRYSFYGSAAEERERIITELRQQRANLTRTARALGMSRNTLRVRMSLLDIRRDGADAEPPDSGRVQLPD